MADTGRRSPRYDAFSEHLANGMTPGQACVAMGLPRNYGSSMLQNLRRRMGAQAV